MSIKLGIEAILAILMHIFHSLTNVQPFCTNMSENEAIWATVNWLNAILTQKMGNCVESSTFLTFGRRLPPYGM